MFRVFTRLGDGEFIFVASRDQLGQAMQLVQDLNTNWPQEYVVRDAEGNNVEPSGHPAIYSNPVAHERPPGSFR